MPAIILPSLLTVGGFDVGNLSRCESSHTNEFPTIRSSEIPILAPYGALEFLTALSNVGRSYPFDTRINALQIRRISPELSNMRLTALLTLAPFFFTALAQDVSIAAVKQAFEDAHVSVLPFFFTPLSRSLLNVVPRYQAI